MGQAPSSSDSLSLRGIRIHLNTPPDTEPRQGGEDAKDAPSLARRALTGAAWLAALNATGSLFVLALSSLLFHRLSDALVQMGLWGLGLTILLSLSTIFEGGLSLTLKQLKGLDRDTLGALSRIEVALGLGGALTLFGLATPAASLLPLYPQAELSEVLRLVAVAMAAIAVGLPQKALLERDLHFKRVGLIESSSTLVFVLAGTYLGLKDGARGLVLATILRHSFESSLYWWHGPLKLRTFLSRSLGTGLGGHLRHALALGGQATLATASRFVDVFLVGSLLGAPALAIYRNLQYLIAVPMSKISVYAGRVGFPVFASVQDDPERLRRGFLRLQGIMALLIFPVLAGLAAVGPRLLGLFFSQRYADRLVEACLILVILCLGAAVLSLSSTASVVMNATGAAREMLSRQLIGTTLVVGLITAASSWGLVALASGRSVAVALWALLILGFAVRRLGISRSTLVLTVMRPFCAALLMGLLVALTGWGCGQLWPASSPFPGPVAVSELALVGVLTAQVCVGAACYPLALHVLGAKPLQELKKLRRRD